MRTGKLISSDGSVMFDADTGFVTGVDDFGDPASFLHSIGRIDVEEWLRRYPGEADVLPNEHDILDFGLYFADGSYDPPCESWRKDREQTLKKEDTRHMSTMTKRIHIVRDQCPEAPDIEPVKITYMRRSRYTLGTEPVTEERAGELAEQMERGEIIGIPVYAYVHSGATIRCSEGGNPFSCPWDSGRSGLAYIRTEDARELFGDPYDSVEALTERAKTCIRGFVALYDAHLRGDVFGFVAETLRPLRHADDGSDAGERWEHEDSCWGFYGDDWETNGIKEEIQHLLDQGYEVVEG